MTGDAIKKLIKQTDIAIGNQEIDPQSGALISANEFKRLGKKFHALSASDRQECVASYLGELGSGRVSEDLFDSFSKGDSYEDYRTRVAPALKTDRMRNLQQMRHVVEEIRATAGGAKPKTPLAWRRLVSELESKHEKFEALAAPYVTNPARRPDPEVEALHTLVQAIDRRLVKWSEGTIERVARLECAFGYLSKQELAQPVVETSEPNSFDVGRAKVFVIRFDQLDQVKATKKHLEPARPLSRESLAGSSDLPLQENSKSEREATKNLILQYIAEPTDTALTNAAKAAARSTRLSGKWIDKLLRALAALFFGRSPTAKETNRKAGLPHRMTPGELHHLSPKDAASLATALVMKYLAYDDAAIVRDKQGDFTPAALGAQNGLDQLGIVELLKQGKAICSQYAQAVQLVFEILQSLQDPNDNQLENCIMRTVVSDFYKDKRGISWRHAWNALQIIQPDGSVVVCQLDATWKDGGNMSDFSFGPTQQVKEGARFYYLEKRMFEDALLDPAWFANFVTHALKKETRSEAIDAVLSGLSAAELASIADAYSKLPSLRGYAKMWLGGILTAADLATFDAECKKRGAPVEAPRL